MKLVLASSNKGKVREIKAMCEDYEVIPYSGLIEEFEHSGLHFIEWADDRLKEILVEFGYDVITINIQKIDNTNDKRKYIIN
jgi:inosine/xanthosine triphosphate pyrophosphatase family protein